MKEFIVTLPTDNIERAYEFYKALGLKLARTEDVDTIPEPLEFRLTESAVLMFAPRDGFAMVTGGNDVASKGTSESVLSIIVGTKAAVEDKFKAANTAGAEIVFEPGEQFMGYACSFKDLDGHVWMVVCTSPR